jgi:hypothetical protein
LNERLLFSRGTADLRSLGAKLEASRGDLQRLLVRTNPSKLA